MRFHEVDAKSIFDILLNFGIYVAIIWRREGPPFFHILYSLITNIEIKRATTLVSAHPKRDGDSERIRLTFVVCADAVVIIPGKDCAVSKELDRRWCSIFSVQDMAKTGLANLRMASG